jgi:hypothetical protein
MIALAKFDNSTMCTQHADPDCVECMKGLDNYIADKVIPVTPDVKDGGYVMRNSALSQSENVEVNFEAAEASVTKDSIEGIATTSKLVSTDEMMSKGCPALCLCDVLEIGQESTVARRYGILLCDVKWSSVLPAIHCFKVD